MKLNSFKRILIVAGIIGTELNTVAMEIPQLYQVKKADTLMTISYQFYGTHQCHEVIKKANSQILDSNRLEVGSLLTIPDPINCQKPVATVVNKPTKKESAKPSEKSEPVSVSERFVLRPYETVPNQKTELSYWSYDSKGVLQRENFTLQKETQIHEVRDFFKPSLIRRKGGIALDMPDKRKDRAPASLAKKETKKKEMELEHWVQILATPHATEAQGYCKREEILLLSSHCQIQNFKRQDTWYRVRLGPFKKLEEARELQRKIVQQNISQAFTVSTYTATE